MRHIWWRDLKKLAMDFKNHPFISHIYQASNTLQKLLKYSNNDTVSMSPTILISHNGVRWCGYLENYIHTLFTIMMPVQPQVSIFVTQGPAGCREGLACLPIQVTGRERSKQSKWCLQCWGTYDLGWPGASPEGTDPHHNGPEVKRGKGPHCWSCAHAPKSDTVCLLQD